MTIELTILISVLSVSFSIFFGLMNFKRNNNSDIQATVRWNTTMETKLDFVGTNIEEIKSQLKDFKTEIKNEIKETNDKLAIVDRKADKANERIDEIIRGNK